MAAVNVKRVFVKREAGHSPVSTALVEGSDRSNAVLPSVLRIVGSAPCCSSTATSGQSC